LKRHTTDCDESKSKKFKPALVSPLNPAKTDTLVEREGRVYPAYTWYQGVLDNKVVHFEAWAKEYRSKKRVEDPNLSDKVEELVILFYRSVKDRLEAKWRDPDAFSEEVDHWFDEKTSTCLLSTICTRLRYLKWIALFMYTRDETSYDILLSLDEIIADTQAASSKNSTNNSLLAIFDPFKLISIGNNVVNLLRKQQAEVIDPFIAEQLRNDMVPKSELVRFGLELRCFIDLAMRFTNVPCRIQATVRLEMPDSTGNRYVSKLIQHGKYFTRVLNKDKVCSSYEATQVPLDDVISLYLSFYIKYCRPREESNYVFQTKTGKVWMRASRDIKQYLQNRGFSPDHIEPNGRFVHGSRHIGLATFAVGVGFNMVKIREYTVLMRHSLHATEMIYTPWLRSAQADSAIKNLSVIRNLDMTHMGDSEMPLIIPLRPAKAIIVSVISRQMLETFSEVNSGFISYEVRSVGTQTYGDSNLDEDPCLENCEEEKSKGSRNIDVEPGTGHQDCDQCRCRMSLCGPYATSRDKDMFGRYYIKCKACKLSNVLWYPLGFTPELPSTSSKPRNLSVIQEFVLKNTGNRMETFKRIK
jgi:hypothetical protein